MRDKLDKRLLQKTFKSINKNKHPEVEVFCNTREDYIIEEVIKMVYHAQAQSIRDGIENKARIKIPGIGQLKIKESRLYAKKKHHEFLDEFGVKEKSELSEEQKQEFEDKMANTMRKHILSKKAIKNSNIVFK